MKNIANKILILFVALAVATAGVLSFIPTIVQPPKEVQMHNMHKEAMKNQVGKFSTVMSEHHNDTIYESLIHRLYIYRTEQYMTDQDLDEQLSAIVNAYIPIFKSQCDNMFSRSEWPAQDLAKISEKIKSLKNLKFYASSAPVLTQCQSAKLSEVSDVMDRYNKAMNLADNARFTTVADAQRLLNEARQYRNDDPLKNNSELMSRLSTVNEKIGKSHYAYVKKQVEKLADYRYNTKDNYQNLIAQVRADINDYKSMSSSYANEELSVSALESVSATYEQAAMKYYNQKRAVFNTNSQWMDISNDNTYKTFYSVSNHKKANQDAVMYITISGYRSFTFQIGSSSQAGRDFVVVGKDYVPTRDNYDHHTKDINNSYKDVTYRNLDPNQTYKIYVVYTKNSSVDRDEDRGYLRIRNDNM